MPDLRKVDIHKQTRLFDDFFQIQELFVSHMQNDGEMSPEQRRLIFERGDSAAVLIFNTDTNRVVLVNQFKAPTLGKGVGGGWVTETVAGMVDRYENPEMAVIREAMEETGYQLREVKPIAKFFSSPGGSSECIYLYYAKVTDADKTGPGGGVGDEDIEVKSILIDELFEMVAANRVEDPKLLIATLWLQEELKNLERMPLGYSSREYALVQHPDLFVGYKTGPIDRVTDVSIWVNSENEDMIMDRFIGRSISSSIRFFGAATDEAGNVIEDTINEDLIREVGHRAPVKIGSVFETGPGKLQEKQHVDGILHVATVRGAGHGLGVKADLGDLARCVTNVLNKAHERNTRFWRRYVRRLKASESILIPLMGTGDGGLKAGDVAPRLLAAAFEYFQDNPETTVKKIYFLAFTAAQERALDRELQRYRHNGIIK